MWATRCLQVVGAGLSTAPSVVLFSCSSSTGSVLCCSEEQDLVPGRRLHHHAEDGPDVALQEEAQASVGSSLMSDLLVLVSAWCTLYAATPPVLIHCGRRFGGVKEYWSVNEWRGVLVEPWSGPQVAPAAVLCFIIY